VAVFSNPRNYGNFPITFSSSIKKLSLILNPDFLCVLCVSVISAFTKITLDPSLLLNPSAPLCLCVKCGTPDPSPEGL
jgi:hypothetical protein